MKKIIFLSLGFIFISKAFVFAGEETNFPKKPLASELTKSAVDQAVTKPLKEDPFAVSTEDLNTSDSLNRISGNIDTGYSSADQSFKSSKSGAPGPFAREKQAESSQNSY